MYNKVFKFNNSGTSDIANENVSKLKIFKHVFCKRMESFAPVFLLEDNLLSIFTDAMASLKK